MDLKWLQASSHLPLSLLAQLTQVLSPQLLLLLIAEKSKKLQDLKLFLIFVQPSRNHRSWKVFPLHVSEKTETDQGRKLAHGVMEPLGKRSVSSDSVGPTGPHLPQSGACQGEAGSTDKQSQLSGPSGGECLGQEDAI